MLALALEEGQYITIADNIVVKVSEIKGSRCYLAIDADRSIPIVRSAVLERAGKPTPKGVNSAPRTRVLRERKSR